MRFTCVIHIFYFVTNVLYHVLSCLLHHPYTRIYRHLLIFANENIFVIPPQERKSSHTKRKLLKWKRWKTTTLNITSNVSNFLSTIQLWNISFWILYLWGACETTNWHNRPQWTKLTVIDFDTNKIYQNRSEHIIKWWIKCATLKTYHKNKQIMIVFKWNFLYFYGFDDI